ncbi:MAG TPA: hypothetical protein VGD89_01260 [Flavipsychrobacter sp.]
MQRYIDPKEGLPLIPLTETEKEHLETIYYSRRRIFAIVFSIIFAWGFIGIFSTTGEKMKHLYKRTRNGQLVKNESYDYEIFGHDLTDTETYWLVRIPVLIPAIIAGGILFKKRIYSYKRDLDLGQKEVVTYTIIRKSYFETTGQYYFSFDNPNYMHYEVDAPLYHSMNEGDSISIYRGKYSKHVFEKDARFTLM